MTGSNTSSSRGWSHPAFERIARVVAAEAGLNLAARPRDTETGIRYAMQARGLGDAAQFARLIETGVIPLDDVVGELTVGETYFFREPQHFDFIRDQVLPEVQRRRGTEHMVRFWSAGCATGEEAYSLSILLDDAGLAGHVLATDVSRKALQRARRAMYRRWSLRGVDETVIRRCFHRLENEWALDERFRSGVSFEFLNLAKAAYPSVPAGLWGMDLILCRNVLIYLDSDTVRRVAHGLAATLADDGWLITGPSDPPLYDIVPALTPIVTRGAVFYRKVRLERAHMGSMASAGVERLQPHSAANAAIGRETTAAGADASRVTTSAQIEDPTAAAIRIRALANEDGTPRALEELASFIDRFPFSTELHLLDAVLRIDMNCDNEATQSLRRVLYLDRSLVIGNFLLAVVLRRQGRLGEARRAYRNARDLAAALPANQTLSLADGERAGTLAEIAASEVALLDSQLV